MSVPNSQIALPANRWAARARTLAAIYLAVLFTATHLPFESHGGVSYADKVVHYAAYAILTMLVLLGWQLTIGVLQPKHYFAVWLVGTLYGAMDEVTQIPVGRTADVNDWAADVLGVVTGLVLFRLTYAIYHRVRGLMVGA